MSRKLDYVGIIQPELVFPYAGIQEQLTIIFRKKGFKNSLRHWANRSGFDDILTDIYDGRVWKTFKGTNNETSPNFFRPEVADSHLGLMLNLDWFQPFDGTNHSTGVLYAAICNLPRDIRFKRENLLIISILPGPNEVSLHKINHYLAPMVDELESLWSGMTLNRTYEYREGRQIRAALILVSCDIPAARKICGHISALAACHRCEKREIMKIINIILPEWKIWRIGSLPEIRPSIVRMLLGGDVAIQTQPEVDLPSKPVLDGPSYFDYHISTQFGF